MMDFKLKDNRIYFTREGEIGVISVPHKGCIRFQATASSKMVSRDFTLMPTENEAETWIDNDDAYLETENLKIRIKNNGAVTYFIDDKVVLDELPEMTFSTGYRNYRSVASNLWSMRVTFKPQDNEKFFGLGHERLNAFDKKGCSIDLVHLNAKSSIPYVYSSLGYGFLWNLPSTGKVDLSMNRTRFSSDCAQTMDYVVIAGTPKEACSKLSDLTGHAPKMPEWAMGFWQSKLRYETQDELLKVAAKYKELNIPISVIVADYFHWTEQGDYKFDPKYWPDPKAMTDKLHEMGIKLMVSMWPTVNDKSENYKYMLEHNMLLKTASGNNRVFDFHGMNAEIDPTNPNTREYVFSKLKENYLDNGVDLLWFDEAEPEIHPEHFDNLIMYEGRGDEVALIYPYYYAKLVYDGMKAIGRDDIVTLSRAAYTGCQKYGALIWSGDIESTFESLTEQVKSGLNMSMCGIPWWNTDIGGFYGGDTTTEYYRELVVRWFQYGVFCPVMRVHGVRQGQDISRDMKEPTGADNEVWSFGEKNTPILTELVKLRYRLIPYISKYMDYASEAGIPIMRPMFMNYPEDNNCYETGDQYMFGDDILVAPITYEGMTSRKVYLPEGKWILVKKSYVNQDELVTIDGGKFVMIDAKIDEFITFVKSGAEVLNAFLSV